jgi:hypothetical protein
MADENNAPASKPVLQSKTAWVMAIAFLAAFIPAAQKWIAENPVTTFQALAAAGVLLRFATSGKVRIFSDDAATGGPAQGGGANGGGSFDEDGYGKGPGSTNYFSPRTAGFLPWLVGLACVVIFPLLTSCDSAAVAAVRSLPITIGVEGEHGTYGYSSEGGLSIAIKGTVREEKSGGDIRKKIDEIRNLRDGGLWEPRRPYRPQRMCAVPVPAICAGFEDFYFSNGGEAADELHRLPLARATLSPASF